MRAIEVGLLPTCQRHGIGVFTYRPLAGAWLSGKYRKDQEVTAPGAAARNRLFPGVYDSTKPANATKLAPADALGALADEAEFTLVQLAIAFATRHPGVKSAIIGPRTTAHLDGHLAADGIKLSTTCSTTSTRSCRPASTSTSPTTCGATPRPPSALLSGGGSSRTGRPGADPLGRSHPGDRSSQASNGLVRGTFTSVAGCSTTSLGGIPARCLTGCLR